MAPKKKVQHKCGYCPDTCKGTKSLQCTVCEQWHHMVCIDGMTDEFFAYLDKQMKDGTFCWMCDKCTSVTKKMLGQMSQLSRRVGELEDNEKLNKARW